ncbi:hypothetical protein FA95DRAFT_1560133 [Auriscalpium vulgare]|uniref:Uncharacterized protein n=1 Tax=Auriscalpium vulgare TaxID=40419 RepID=A0ACB8RS23_9AGAM|nr:hypothetical protein FA95DRAFT_1560133 [Auriscalpium vulgare]
MGSSAPSQHSDLSRVGLGPRDTSQPKIPAVARCLRRQSDSEAVVHAEASLCSPCPPYSTARSRNQLHIEDDDSFRGKRST